MTEHKYTNKLINEKSPYLLQHAHNPVDWYPWGPEAFSRAVAEDKPIFLSCGYSTCHWCHVMELESFENPEVAQVLNKHFISIKVDREERPDIDHIYMTVCQALTGSGGWPLTIFMTPDKKPFFAGTYFPKQDRGQLSGLMTLLDRVHHAWTHNRDALLKSGNQVVNILNQSEESSEDEISEEVIHEAFSQFKYDFDSVYGGFSGAPKFPTPHNLYFLQRYWYKTKDEAALEMVEKTLDSMYRGGIYDHIGFGFSRYSTDRKWLVPHFEKMLYDNALLAIAYLEAFQATKKQQYADVAHQIFTYVLRDMTSPEGGFYSAEDADSEGVEGKFYLWSVDEVKQILGDKDAEKFCQYYDISEKGNFEDLNIPNLIKATVPEEEKQFVEACRQKLFDVREKRVHPYKDDKILTAWNGLMISAMAMGGRILNEQKYISAAENAVEFIMTRLVRNDGRLMARYRDGESAFPAYIDDYAFFIWGLIELYETTYKPDYLMHALRFNNYMLQFFSDEENGGLFLYGSDSEQLITRPKEVYDGATPSGNSVATLNFLRLARLTGQSELEDLAHQQFKTFGGSMERMPKGYTFMVTAFLHASSKSREIIVVSGTDQKTAYDMLSIVKENFMPFTISALYSDEYQDIKRVIPFIENYKSVNNKATAYVCENYACSYPVNNATEFKDMLS